jgi:hypothetical protein
MKLHRVSWSSIEFLWSSIRILHGTLWSAIEVQWSPMELYEEFL